MLDGFQEVEFDFVADKPGMTLFHCPQQLHMDFGFVFLLDYARSWPATAVIRVDIRSPGWSARSGLYFVLLLGAVNLFADTTYEGAAQGHRSFPGNARRERIRRRHRHTGFEFLGYALRLVSGPWGDRSRLYWQITSLAGYILQMVSVPALALSGSWPVAARGHRAIAGGSRDRGALYAKPLSDENLLLMG